MYTDAEIKKKANWKLCDICSIMYTDAEIKKRLNGSYVICVALCILMLR